ncbi:uncharacterized protein UV8b_02890 [Ustilaginoidea virens]|uniref:WSC domain-containing protein n=1 Tax=Ustilaginoidea virens TaxID=1159556 RepID=A0A1B5L3F0_USTVR|nr:uncharacterized protein UV8b_02890 [Ustilaginoidea virens]QUC18649.1 hypothetical protein UV8b_02890 [Ustilaginoidea virens]GAO16937.1 hypothetical protein UVI_02046240 [Ustilaginoidea virens]
MTVEQCVAECKGNGFRYAGLEYYGVCYCGATVNGPQLDESKCSFPCSGNKTEKCGGDNTLSVWQDPTFPKAPNEVTVQDYKSLGCYTDESHLGRTLSYPLALDAATFTTKKCLAACEKQGYPFAGTEFGKECWCGVVLANDTAKADNAQCDMPCQGDSSATCGGRSRLSLWVAKDLESLEPCDAHHGATTTALPPATTAETTKPVESTASTKPAETTTTGPGYTSTTKPAETTTTGPRYSTTTAGPAETTSSGPGLSTTATEPAETTFSGPGYPTTTGPAETTTTGPEDTSTTGPAGTTTTGPGYPTTTAPAETTTTGPEDTTTTTGPAETTSSGPGYPTTTTGPAESTTTCLGDTRTTGPAETTTTGPGYPTTTAPAETTTTGPEDTTTTGPAESTTTCLGDTRTTGPAETTTTGPGYPTTTAPAETTTTGPEDTTTTGPAESTTTGPEDTSTTGPAETTPTGPAYPTTTGPAETSSGPGYATPTAQQPSHDTKTRPTGDETTSTGKPYTTATGPLPTTEKPTTTTTSPTTGGLCTSPVTVPPKCEWQCGNWCAPPLPHWNDKKGCRHAQKTCHQQVSSCFKNAGWPGSVDCFKFKAWCFFIDSYCQTSCPSGSCGKWDCWNKHHGGDGNAPSNPPSSSTTVYPCPATSKTPAAPTTTKPAASCRPQPTNICTQPANEKYGYGPGKPVGGIPLPVVGCNDCEDEFDEKPFKFYTEADSHDCPGFPWPAWPSVCTEACEEQHRQCVDTYSKGCETLGWKNGFHRRAGESFDRWDGSKRRPASRGSDSESCASAGSDHAGVWLEPGSDSFDCWGWGGNQPSWAIARCDKQYKDCVRVNRWVDGEDKCKAWPGC